MILSAKSASKAEREKYAKPCAQKAFPTLGVDYRVVTDTTADWWESEVEQGKMGM
jgi:hypothetical protein